MENQISLFSHLMKKVGTGVIGKMRMEHGKNIMMTILKMDQQK
jgi:hypothetical protein